MYNRSCRSMAAVLTALFLLAGCGGEATPAAPATEPPPAAASQSEVATAAAAQAASPLAQPDSPLAEVASPLALPQGSSFGNQVMLDMATIQQMAEQNAAPKAAEGKASVSGVLYSSSLNRIIPGTRVYLTPSLEANGELYPPSILEGVNPEKGDVGSFSDDLGRFSISDVPPGNYYLLVWTVYDYLMLEDAQAQPLVLRLEPDSQNNLGVVTLPWP